MRAAIIVAVFSIGCGPALKVRECPVGIATKSELTHTVDTQYFEVDGRTPRQILENELAKAPFKDDLKHAVAATRTRVCRDATYLQEPSGSCHVAAVRIVVQLLFVMPAWKPSGKVDPSTSAWWTAHAELGSKHEQGHAAVALQTADEMYREVLALPEAASCEELKKQTSAIFEAADARMNDRNRIWDETNEPATENMPSSP